MRRKIKVLLYLSCLFLWGCETIPSKSMVDMNMLTLGMNPQEAQGTLKDAVVVGYKVSGDNSSSYKPIIKVNPHRTDRFKKGGNNYEVAFYFTHINQADGQITDDELTPLVFENNKLIGYGWPFTNNFLKNR